MRRFIPACFGALMLLAACGGGGASTGPDPRPLPSVWSRSTDFPGGVPQGGAAFLLGSSAVVVGGTDGQQVSGQCHAFDPTARTWTRRTDFPGTRRADATAFTFGGRGYVLLGWTDGNGLLKDVWSCDPGTGAWTRKQDFPGEARILPVTFVFGARVYVVGGGHGDVCFKDVWEYDATTDAWTRKRDFPGEGLMSAGAFVVGAKGYMGTGQLAGTGYTTTKAFWEYDPATDAWARKADFPGVARGFALGFALNGRGYMGLGVASVTPPLSLPVDLWSYDPAANAWTRQEDLPAAGRGMAVAFTLGSGAFLGLGNDASMRSLSDLWQFTPR